MLLTDVAYYLNVCIRISYHIVRVYGYLYFDKAILQRKVQGSIM